jgi:putative pyruvate formate lyase activating enzyme
MKKIYGDRNSLSIYFEILSEKRKPKYIDCREKKIIFEDSMCEKDLWKLHDEKTHDEKKCKTIKTTAEKSFLDLKIELAKRILESCRLCERRCGVNRLGGKHGHCGVLQSKISSEFFHYGEEPELIPSYTIFFAGCTFNCVFCQNYDISQNPENGVDIEPIRLAEMIEKRAPYCRNVNWVGGDPTPNLLYILETLKNCNAQLPQIWNSNMYMSEECMKLLDGVIDLYLSDFKYGNNKCAKRLSNIDNFFEIVSRNHKIANDQCEMMIRHLVMPNHVECCSKPILDWIASNLHNVKVNVMAQYRPEYKAHLHRDIDRELKHGEFLEARRYAEKLGLDLE